MADDVPTERAQRLLGLLREGQPISGDRLARELGVSARTLRRDADRLRREGHTLEARPGPGGSYRLIRAPAPTPAPPGAPAPTQPAPDPWPVLRVPDPRRSSHPELSADELAATVRALRATRSSDASRRALAKLRQQQTADDPAALFSERTSRPHRSAGCAAYGVLLGFSSVRARIPSVARMLVSGMTGNMSRSR